MHKPAAFLSEFASPAYPVRRATRSAFALIVTVPEPLLLLA